MHSSQIFFIQTMPLGMIWMTNYLLNNNYNMNIEILVYKCFGCPHIYWNVRRYYTIQLIYQSISHIVT
jgi:hypothetical protein